MSDIRSSPRLACPAELLHGSVVITLVQDDPVRVLSSSTGRVYDRRVPRYFFRDKFYGRLS